MDSDEIEQEDEYLKQRDIILRSYQVKLLNEAQKGNTILYLPTGSGKTLIAIHLLCSRAAEIRRPFNEGGKRAFFMANTKVLVHQLYTVIKTHTRFKVAEFTGDMNVDTWNRDIWLTHFKNNHVLVLTGEILRQILQLNFIKPSDISLLVVDECHHAVANHPYRRVMQSFEGIDPSEAPLVLGLSAVLLNSSPKKDQVLADIQALEKTLKAKIITEADLHALLRFSANPTEKMIVFKEDQTQIQQVLHMFTTPCNVFERMVLTPPDRPELPCGGIDFMNRNKAKRIKNVFVNCKYHFEELGVFCGAVSALFHMIILERFRLLSNDQKEIQALIYARTEMNKIRHAALAIAGEEETGHSIFKFSSPKVQELINTIKETQESAGSKPISTVVFVHRRGTATVLAHVFKRLSAVDSRFSFIKAEFVVGHSTLAKDGFSECKTNEIVQRFAAGSLNLLFATNLLEEGIDISACNVVMSFDFPLGYPTYFQSRGRARDKNSYYFLFVKEGEVTEKEEVLNSYRRTERELHERGLEEKEMEDEEDESCDDLEEIRLHGKSRTLTVDGLTAIKAVIRYCSKLPQDRYSLLAPTSWYIKLPGGIKKAFVQLPVNCPLVEVVEGEEKKNVKLAKRSAYLATLKKLYEMGELDEDLNPRSYDVKEEDFRELFPHYRNEVIDKSLPQPGTRKRKQMYEAKFAESLSNCLPQPGAKSYLHVIDLKVAFDKPDRDRKVAIYEDLQVPVTFAMISSRKLRKILQFPLFLDMGRINCDLLVDYDEIVLSEDEISDIKACHFALFKKVTRILKNFQVFDNSNKGHSFLVAPVEKNKDGRFVLNWEVIRCDFCRNSKSALVRYNPTASRCENWHLGIKRNLCEEILNDDTSLVPGHLLWGFDRMHPDSFSVPEPKFEMTEADYRFSVLVPYYRRQEPPQYYIVNKFCRDMSPLSPFPRPLYKDYLTYYGEKYMIEITNTAQPLLRVSPLYGCSNFNKPRDRKPRRAREKFKEYEEHLIPELCAVVPFDRRYWLKAQLIPTAINRICHVYCVDEFGREMAAKTKLGAWEPAEGKGWRPLEICEATVDEDEEEGVGAGVEVSELKSALTPSEVKGKTHSKAKVLRTPEAHLYEFGVCELELYLRRLAQAEFQGDEIQKEESEVAKLMSMPSVSTPALKALKGDGCQTGPDLALLVQATTSKSSNDIVDYERLEILGDSFLKFAVTLYLFRNYTENEGVLTSLKGKVVGNKNLLYCGLDKNFQDVLNVTDFAPTFDWNPPLFCVPEKLVDGIVSENVDPAVLYRLEITHEEQFSGILSESTLNKSEEIIQSYEKDFQLPSNSLLPYKVMADKVVSDCVEALIGSYFLTLGLPGAFDFLLWLGVLPKPKGSYQELLEKPSQTPPLPPSAYDVVVNLLNEVNYSELEDILNYRFENKVILLEALTHPSCMKNRITDCYQRLEFLGDAVLDFLITTYVYENCGELTPGQVTDIRSSLVNNVTFACLVVRYELYKYMLSFSSTLNAAIQNFNSYQTSRNHAIDENVSVLLEETDFLMGETVHVPKALGDIFESLAGAIFLDSGNSLETVWKVYYRLMKRELDEFTKTVPKSCVRLLQEICGDKPYYEYKTVGNVTKVTCTIYYQNEEVKGFGIGASKKEGKKSAAKLVLNKVLKLRK